MKHAPYPNYKPSGVEWLGDVPEHWEVKNLRWIGESITGLTYSPADIVSEHEGTLVLRSSNIQNGRITLDDNIFVSTEIPRRLYANEDDILICSRNGSRDLVGKCAKLTKFEKVTWGAFMTVFRSQASEFMFYIFNSDLFAFQSGLYQTSTIFQLTIGTLNSMKVPLPSIAEQRAIAAYLDRETGRIDALVAKNRELMERLKEKRTALISRTVTRGLPSEAARAAGLPVNPPLKPSGIEWLGDIPAHWEVKRLNYLATLKSGENITSEMISEGGDYPVFGGNGLRGYYHQYTHDGHYVLIGRQGALCGNINYGSGRFWASEHALVVTPIIKISAIWLGELLRIMNLGQYSITAAQPGIAAEVIRALKIPVPPYKEQTAIAAYLDSETARIDALSAKIETSIERLNEYRTALITAAVTGKIDIRKAKA